MGSFHIIFTLFVYFKLFPINSVTHVLDERVLKVYQCTTQLNNLFCITSEVRWNKAKYLEILKPCICPFYMYPGLGDALAEFDLALTKLAMVEKRWDINRDSFRYNILNKESFVSEDKVPCLQVRKKVRFLDYDLI